MTLRFFILLCLGGNFSKFSSVFVPGGFLASQEAKAVNCIHLTVWKSGVIHPDDSLI